MQPLPEEEIIIRDDQDPRVSTAEVLCKGMICPDLSWRRSSCVSQKSFQLQVKLIQV